VLVLAAAAGVFFLRAASTPAIESITPARVGLGQSVTIRARTSGHGGGERRPVRRQAGRVVQATPTRLQVEIPEMTAAAGRDTPVPVVVVVDGHESKAATVGVFEAPRIHGIAPAVAMPGDEVVLAGAGWARASPCGSAAPRRHRPGHHALVAEGDGARRWRVAPARSFPVRVASAPTPPTPRLSSSAACPS
jgi:hypothetical protein